MASMDRAALVASSRSTCGKDAPHFETATTAVSRAKLVCSTSLCAPVRLYHRRHIRDQLADPASSTTLNRVFPFEAKRQEMLRVGVDIFMSALGRRG